MNAEEPPRKAKPTRKPDRSAPQVQAPVTVGYANGIPRLTTAVNEVTRLADAAPGGSNSGASVEVRGDSCVGFQSWRGRWGSSR